MCNKHVKGVSKRTMSIGFQKSFKEVPGCFLKVSKVCENVKSM